MSRSTICAAVAIFAVTLCSLLISPARAQLGGTDTPGHGNVLQAPAGEPVAQLAASPVLPSFFMDGFSRMALAVSRWSLSPAVRPSAAVNRRTGLRRFSVVR